MPCASATKSRSGPRVSSIARALGPAGSAPTRLSSMFSTAYDPLFQMIVVTSRPCPAILPRLCPPRLERVHRAAVGLQRDDAAVAARHRGADRDGEALTDRTAGE